MSTTNGHVPPKLQLQVQVIELQVAERLNPARFLVVTVESIGGASMAVRTRGRGRRQGAGVGAAGRLVPEHLPGLLNRVEALDAEALRHVGVIPPREQAIRGAYLPVGGLPRQAQGGEVILQGRLNGRASCPSFSVERWASPV